MVHFIDRNFAHQLGRVEALLVELVRLGGQDRLFMFVRPGAQGQALGLVQGFRDHLVGETVGNRPLHERVGADALDAEAFLGVRDQDFRDQVFGLRGHEQVLREAELQLLNFLVNFLLTFYTLTSSDSKGGFPNSNVYMMMPQAQMSTWKEYPAPFSRTSGAR